MAGVGHSWGPWSVGCWLLGGWLLGASAAAIAVDDLKPVPVRAAPLKNLLIQPEITAPATVVSQNRGSVSAELNAAITRIVVQVGDIVEPGSLLAQLDCRRYELALAELDGRIGALDARLELARSQLQRAKTLQSRQSFSQEALDERQAAASELAAERQQLAAMRAQRELDIERCDVRSPYRAIVLRRSANPGDYAQPGTPLVEVLDIDQVELEAEVLEVEADSLLQSSSLLFRYREQEYPVTLRTLLPVVDQRTRTRTARLRFAEPAATMLTGANGRLAWRGNAALPPHLLVQREGKLGVLLVDEQHRARFMPIKGAQEGRPAAVIDPPERALVIVEGHYNLLEGMPVRPEMLLLGQSVDDSSPKPRRVNAAD